ncbi:MAG: methylmalonyl-CoA mutase family protein, partial [Nocardioides sp.]
MTEQDPVEGGLAEPTELEPAQGSLALMLDGAAGTRADWEKAAAAVLRKAGRLTGDDADGEVWDELTLTTYDGIDLSPLGTPALLDGVRSHERPTRVGARDIRSYLNLRGKLGQELALANTDALADLEGGVTSLWLELAALMDVDELDRALDGVMIDLAPVVLLPSNVDCVKSAFEFEKLVERRGVVPAPGTNLGADPLGGPLRGSLGEDQPEGWPWDSVSVARTALRIGTLGLVADGSAAHDIWATEAQELGWSIAAAVHYLRRMVDARIDLDDAVGVLEFRYAATDDQFLTIAKLRAARRLWARVLEASGAKPVAQRQHAVTSRPMMSRYDPYVNLLRTTVAAFAAAVGGADAITVLPFDSLAGRSDPFARRIARNTSALLVEESHVAVVTDPAGGSYAVEKLTDDLAIAGWEEFQRIEAAGGAYDALENRSFFDRVDETAKRRQRDVATRRRPITGLTEFPNLAEKLPERPEQTSDFDHVRRWGEDFEDMRDTPPSTPVFLAPLGTVAAHTARATFATNLLAAGGIAVELGEYDGQAVVCVAGTDAAYDESGAETAAALRQAGAKLVIVAGQPRDWA